MAFKSATATILADRIVFAHAGEAAMVDTRLWRSPFGLVGRYLPGDEPEPWALDDPLTDPEASGLAELPAPAAGGWMGSDARVWLREFETGEETAPLPRAVQWAALLRTLRHRAGLAAAEMTVRLASTTGGPMADGLCRLDLLRAAALADARVDAADAIAAADADTARWIGCWADSLPWGSLDYLEDASPERTLIGGAVRLPARARFGQTFRRSVASQDSAEVSLRFSVGGAHVVCRESELQDLQGALEFEATWHRHGSVDIDVVVDGAWRPIQRIALLDDDPRASMTFADREAVARPRGEFAMLSGWSETLSALPIDVLPAFDLSPIGDGGFARAPAWGEAE